MIVVNKKLTLLSTVLAVVLLALPVSVFSQYGTPESGLGRFLAENPDLKTVDEVHVNVPYERGKSVYRGRAENVAKLKYCIVHKGEKVKIKRSSMRSYVNGTYSGLSKQLYNCEKPDNKIINELPRKEFLEVLYYLDVEYKLSLQRK